MNAWLVAGIAVALECALVAGFILGYDAGWNTRRRPVKFS